MVVSKNLDRDPARAGGPLPHLLPTANAKTKHHPALPYADLRPFLVELENHGWPLAAKGLRFTILTATRADEVLSATWAEFDLERAGWAIPAERMTEAHVVPLSAAALAILSALPRGGENDWPFKMGERTMYLNHRNFGSKPSSKKARRNC
jgi:integrase